MKKTQTLLALLLAVLLLVSAAPAALAEESEEATSPWEVEEPPIEVPEWSSIAVSNVDELLGAIAPETTVVLAPGTYDLTAADSYGSGDTGEWYRWEDTYDGYQLVLQNMEGLQIVAPEGAEIVTQPRYANVLNLRGCTDTLLAGLTLGHSLEPGICTGGVVYLSDCDNTEIRSCRLYGCGIQGIEAISCEKLHVSFTQIYDCSYWGLTANSCRDFLIEDCWIHDCGFKTDAGFMLLQVSGCRNFAVVNTRISDNRMLGLMKTELSKDTCLLGCTLDGNRFEGALFSFSDTGAVVADCSFSQLGTYRYYDVNTDTVFAKDAEGEDLLSFDLDRMQRQRVSYEPSEAGDGPEADRPEPVVGADGIQEVRVSTVDELLAAIAPDTRIILEEGDYDLSSAAGYGVSDSEWYTWEQRYDGPSLSIVGVQNLSLEGAGRGLTRITARPRYATVLSFSNCDNIRISGLTAGHTEEEGFCSGNVLDLYGCRNVEIAGCGFFGCGVIGIYSLNCRYIQVLDTDIYACSDAAGVIDTCRDVTMDNCSIYGCRGGNDRIIVNNSSLSWNGEALEDGIYTFSFRECLGKLASD
ncbi:MAG: right-handed parallel beta-helix repeat-containing protein [Oscillospiraceae bacterium]|nr:right-handed parallel beta-helix repeat-containing protein [Oscillospiraceae bacterium]